MADLVGRRDECAALDQLVADVLAGASHVLILRGDAGVGKSALLGYLSNRIASAANGGESWRVASAVGVESEMELAYSGLHQLCAPLLDHLDELPPPQRDALTTVFGLSTGPAPDRFLVGLAALTLVAQAAEQLRGGAVQPLRVVDDAGQRVLLGGLRHQRQRGQSHQEPVRRRTSAQPENSRERVALRDRQLV